MKNISEALHKVILIKKEHSVEEVCVLEISPSGKYIYVTSSTGRHGLGVTGFGDWIDTPENLSDIEILEQKSSFMDNYDIQFGKTTRELINYLYDLIEQEICDSSCDEESPYLKCDICETKYFLNNLVESLKKFRHKIK